MNNHDLTTPAGLFVVLEGGDGAGKTTQLQHLAKWLSSTGHDPLVTFEPGDTGLGRHLRQSLLDPASGDVDPRAEALLYAADKAQHLHQVIRPALAQGRVVLCDRYVDSMIAYQGAGRRLDLAEIKHVAQWATLGLIPDLTILLDVPVARGVGAKTGLDRIEAAGQGFHQRVREHFLSLAQAAPERYLVLPARDPIQTTAAAVRNRVQTLLDNQGTEA